MYRHASSFFCGVAILACGLVLAGCDGVSAGVDQQELQRTRVTLRYQVDATYATCTVAHNNALRQPEQHTVTAFPWEKTLTVEVTAEGPFVASIVATCADSSKAGKSTVFVYRGDQVVARGSAAGFGASSQATVEVRPTAAPAVD